MAQRFVEQIRPILERRDNQALAATLDGEWPHDQLVAFLDPRHPDAVKVALICLALTGQAGDEPRIVPLLHDDDAATVAYAEYALWSIWFRSCPDPEAVEALNAAIHLIGEDCLAAAVEQLDALIARSPDFAEVYNQRAIAFYLQGDYEQAIADCRQTLQLNPCHFGAWAGLGHCYVTCERLEEALDAYTNALRIHPRLEGIRQTTLYLQECLHLRQTPDSPRAWPPSESAA